MQKKLRRVHTKGRGGSSWDLWVVQLCIDLLVTGVTPSAIPTTIQTRYKTFYGKCPEGRVSIDFVRRCRPVAEALGYYYMVAMFLAERSPGIKYSLMQLPDVIIHSLLW